VSRLQLRQLAAGHGRQAVFQGLDLDIADGEFIVLLGPSGCGKSTLLHAIAGLVEVQQGQVLIDGRDMTDADPSERGVGMVFQSYALYPTMSVAGNIGFALRVAGLPAAEVEQRVLRVARLLQLEPLLQRKPAQLSGGQRQRVAIGRALARESSLCLFDEPLSNLDAQLRTELRRELKQLHRQLGSTMVYVTHDQVEAMTLATRLVVMHEGRIQQVGTPAEVYGRPANRFVAGFVGSPGMAFEAGTLRVGPQGQPSFVSARLQLPLDPATLDDAPRDGRAVLLGLRAEQVRLQVDGPHEAAVQLIEPLGGQAVVWLDLGGCPLAALWSDGAPPALDQRVRFTLSSAGASVFDAATGQRC
jgi:multiple sugar transport system ATP-binding protein